MSPTKPLRAALYARVSTDRQSTENQLQELRRVAEQRGWTIVHEYVDRGISGAAGRDKRPNFDALHRDAVRGAFDIVMAWSVCRLGRSLQDLVGFLNELNAARVNLYLHTQGLDTTTPSGRAMYGMLSVFADFERAMIQERVRAGLQRARRAGKQLGRPTIGAESERAIRVARGAGKSFRAIAAETGHALSTVQRVLNDAA